MYLSYIGHVLRKWLFRIMVLKKSYISHVVGINQNFSEKHKETMSEKSQ